MTFDEFRPPFASTRLEDVEFNIEENADYRFVSNEFIHDIKSEQNT